MVRVQSSPRDPESMLKAFGNVVMVALYRREYSGEAMSGVRLSSEVTSANNFPTSSLATTEEITDRHMGERMLLNSDRQIAGRGSAVIIQREILLNAFNRLYSPR